MKNTAIFRLKFSIQRYFQLGFALIGLVCFVALLVAFLAPLGVSVVISGGKGSAGGTQFIQDRLLRALIFTLQQAGASALLALCIGLPCAFLTSQRTFFGRRILLSLSGVPLCVPPVIIALAFVLFYGREGYLNTFLMQVFSVSEPPITFLYSFWGLIIAHGLYNFPVVMRTVHQVWERLPENTEEAASLLGASRARIFLTITLPSLFGTLLSSFILVFLYCFFSFVIVLLFGTLGGSTLEVELYQAARSLFDFSLAGKIALIETALALLFLFLYAKTLTNLSQTRSALTKKRSLKNFKSWREIFVSLIFLSLIVLFFIAPLMSVFFRSLVSPQTGRVLARTPVKSPAFLEMFNQKAQIGIEHALNFDSWRILFSRSGFIKALLNTLATGLGTAFVSTMAALFYAYLSESFAYKINTKFKHTKIALAIIPLAPLAVSSVMLGFGWTLLVPNGTMWVLVLAQSSIAWTFAWSQIKTGLDRIPPEITEASKLLSSGSLDGWLRTQVPLIKNSIASGAAFAFAVSAGDATLPLVLSLGTYENLALRLFRLAGAYRFGEACACATLVALLGAIAFVFQDEVF